MFTIFYDTDCHGLQHQFGLDLLLYVEYIWFLLERPVSLPLGLPCSTGDSFSVCLDEQEST